jgi:hypothetical protein
LSGKSSGKSIKQVENDTWKLLSVTTGEIEALLYLCPSDTGKKFIKEYQFIPPTISILS